MLLQKCAGFAFAHPATRGSRIALIAETDNAESPRMAYIIPIRGQPQIYTNGTYTTTHAGYNIPTVSIHHCLVFLQFIVICEITSSKRQASDKRSFHKSSIHPHYPHYRLSASKMPCKGNTIIWIIYYNEA